MRTRYGAAGAGCTSNFGVTGEYFVGESEAAAPNVAAGEESGVVAGQSNEACDDLSVIGGGISNVIGSELGGATKSFIGAGNLNGITGDQSFIGAGYNNGVSGESSFVGAGDFGDAAGAGSFVGAGGYAYGEDVTGAQVGGGNIAAARDSFVGAGDLNQIGTDGNGSFIGAGGYTLASEGYAAQSNQIEGADSFIGAGDSNYVATTGAFVGAGDVNEVVGSAPYGAVVGGSSNIVNGANAFIGAGYENQADATDAFVGGGTLNNVQSTSANYSAVVAGSGNNVSAPYSFIGGGNKNSAASSASYSAVAGGSGNNMSAPYAFIGGGNQNSATAPASYSVLAGGLGNAVTGQKGSLGGGEANEVAGSFAVVPGGYHDDALGNESFAAGSQAEAKYAGSFVWSDYVSSEKPQTDSAINQFVARASGGVYFFSNAASSAGVHLASGSGTWSSLSDRNAKTNIVALDDDAILAKVASLPISAWQYKTERGVTHFGPMAQDFFAAFGTGEDDRHITSIDEDGVALAAIKALRADDERRDAADKRKDADIVALRAELQHLEAIVKDRQSH